MKLLSTLILLIFSGQAFCQYESYIQIDKSTTPGKYFVLHLLSDINQKDKNKGSIANFLIAPGETVEATKINKLFPNKRFYFKVSMDKKKSVFAIFEVTVTEGSNVIYKSRQKLRVTHCYGF